jgi:predicted PurR-regulated permease PerM
MRLEQSFERVAGVAALFLLAVSCLLVLAPFVTAILWAAILAYSTWPLYQRLERRLGGGARAAAVMTVLVGLVLVVPPGLLVTALAGDVRALVEPLRAQLADGLPAPPAWIAGLPVVGPAADEFLRAMASDSRQMVAALRSFLDPATQILLSIAAGFGRGVFDMLLSVIIAYFFWAHGEPLGRRTRAIVGKFTGRAEHIVSVTGATIRSVVYGLIGTALVQGVLALVGFAIAGVPGAILLGVMTTVLSLIPMGPPLVWVPATLWLLWSGETGWAIFMGLWGLLIISSADNVVRPFLISLGTEMPLLLILLGVLGGILAFGLVGAFIGPTLLAVAYNLVLDWTAERTPAGDGVEP